VCPINGARSVASIASEIVLDRLLLDHRPEADLLNVFAYHRGVIASGWAPAATPTPMVIPQIMTEASSRTTRSVNDLMPFSSRTSFAQLFSRLDRLVKSYLDAPHAARRATRYVRMPY
jgi:hypothetical protein